MTLKAIQFSSIMLYALVMGVFWGTWFALSRSIDTVTPATFLENGKAIIANLAVPMRFLMPGAVLASLAMVYFTPDRRSMAFRSALAGALLMVTALIITLAVNVPIDNQIKVWTLETLPADWGAMRDRWETFHALRTFISIGSLAALMVSVLASRPAARASRR